MKLRIRTSTTIISSCLALVAVFSVSALFFSSTTKSVQAQSAGGRLITVHDRGVSTAFLTSKDTLKDALAEHGIAVNEKDAVEPAVDEKLVAPEYQVNIYRARPVTVIDGGVRQRIVTPYQSTERIVKDAGIELHAEDETALSRSSDVIADGAGLQLTIDRATVLSIDLYGVVSEIRSQSETVGELLKEKGIILGDAGRASVALSTKVVEGMDIRVWREGKQTITAEEVIAFETEQVKDADREVGYKQVQTEGQNGLRSVTYEIEIKDGVEVSRTEIASLTKKESVKQVEVVGSKQKILQYTGGGSKTEWLAASGIPASDWGYADSIVSRESGWNPCAYNPSRSNCALSSSEIGNRACGLAQSLPCGKQEKYGHWTDPVANLKWQYEYVKGRYGSYANAYAFWQKNRWY